MVSPARRRLHFPVWNSVKIDEEYEHVGIK